MTESVTSTVPIRFVGESVAATKFGGIMTHPRTDVHVTARAADLPEFIEVDLSGITELHGSIKVGDLPDSAVYKVIDSADEVLAMVEAPKEEVEGLEPSAEAAEEGAQAVAAETETEGEAPAQAEAAPEAAAESA
jgi:large subunit ribosomal protein L25